MSVRSSCITEGPIKKAENLWYNPEPLIGGKTANTGAVDRPAEPAQQVLDSRHVDPFDVRSKPAVGAKTSARTYVQTRRCVS